MEAGRDTESLYTHDTCTVLEAMGRNAGWIAAAAGLASRESQDAPHMIFVPEIAFDIKQFERDAKAILKKHKRLFIVASEGMKTKDGNYLAADTGKFAKDAFGHAQLGGAAEAMKNIVEEKLGIKARVNKLGTNQRAAMHFASKTDIDEAYMCGKEAVAQALKGTSGKMVTLVRAKTKTYKCGTGLTDLSAVANDEKFLPRSFMNKAGNHITKKMRDYLTPLVKGEAPITVGPDGLPVFMRFKRVHVKKKCKTLKVK
jgi:6-phosphofructokinase 1